MNAILAQLRAAAAAFSFLSRLPTPVYNYSERDFSASLFWFPGVGAVLGATVAGVLLLSRCGFAAGFAAVLALLAGVVLSGGLHLDGLADTIDGFAAGHKDRTRILAVMSDSRIGAHGASGLVLVLLAKWSLLSELITRAKPQEVIAALAFSALSSRLVAALAVAYLPSAKPGGLADLFRGDGARLNAALGGLWWLLALVLVVLCRIWAAPSLLATFQPWAAPVASTLIVAVSFAAWARYLVKHIGGTTGDTIGAWVEVGEALALAAWELV